MNDVPLPWEVRVAVWDAAQAAVRRTLRGQGLREVVTPVRLSAVAIEPFIEPLPAGAGGWLATSPELPMKQLLCRGAPSIFQIAPCFRAAEWGDRHREQFRLVEWYRLAGTLRDVQDDVERLVAAVHEAVAGVLDDASIPAVAAPARWSRRGVVPLMEQTMGVRLRGDEDAVALHRALAPVSAALGDPLATVREDRLSASPGAHALAAWTALFSAWCDRFFDPWLAKYDEPGLHVVDFPAPLAALSRIEGPVAHRFESHVRGIELANGYDELRDPDEQRARFLAVNELRASYDAPALPLPEEFLADLRDHGLPPCSGAALGLDRLVLLATGRARLSDIAIELSAPRP